MFFRKLEEMIIAIIGFILLTDIIFFILVPPFNGYKPSLIISIFLK